MTQQVTEISNRKNGNQVGQFVRQVRRRLNWHGLLTCILWTSAIGGGVMLCIAVGHVWLGYRVPVLAYAIVAGGCGASALTAWLLSRINDDSAAHFADTHFGLKDSVRSCCNFHAVGLEGGFYSLQAAQTKHHVARQSFDTIRYRPSYRLTALAGLLVMVSIALGFKGPSQSVLDRIELEIATAGLTTNVNEQLRELVDELDRSLDDEDERKLIDPDKLRQWVGELEETKDHREALRQYAKLERMINRAADALQQRREEQVLDAAAEELKKDAPTVELGDLLKQKKYDKASEKLGELAPDKKGNESESDKKLSEKQKELANLKAAANRMADAARNSSGRPRQSGNQKTDTLARESDGKQSENRNQGQKGESSGDPKSASNQSPDGELAQMLEDLEESVEELDQAMEQAELEEGDQNNQEAIEECQACKNRVQGEMDKLGKKLMRMARQRSAQAKLKQLGAQCNSIQSGVAKSASPNAGGKEAGQGTSDNTRVDQDDPDISGWNSALKGIKGEGPSLTKVESADDGTGVSGRTNQAKQREFKRQFESFVEREDIPENLKSGVKNYFIQIHESNSPSGNLSEIDPSANKEVDDPDKIPDKVNDN